MTKEQFFNEYKSIQMRHKKELNDFFRGFACDNNIVQVGDTVCDVHGAIIVEKISWSRISFTSSQDSLPECVYVGTRLTKKMAPRKDGGQGRIFQRDLISVNGVNYEKLILQARC